MSDFDRGLEAWRAHATQLVDEGVALLAAQTALPCPDGLLAELAEILARLPVSRRHTAPILQLLGQADPHLQEAGLLLATAAVRARGLPGEGGSEDAVAFAAPVARLLENARLDPWVFAAAVDWLAEAPATDELVPVYAAALAAAARGSAPDAGTICRASMTDPVARLERHLDRLFAGSVEAGSPLQRVLLPWLELRHGTQGVEATRAAAQAAAWGGRG